MKYMAQPGAPPAAWQGPLFKDYQAKTNSTIRLEHKNSDTPLIFCWKTDNSRPVNQRLEPDHRAAVDSAMILQLA